MAEKYVAREPMRVRQVRRSSVHKTLVLTIIVCTSFPKCLHAQPPIIIPITSKPVGSGARALGQSAFIAVADDATAASWNPAGLINLERPEVSFVGAWRSVEDDYSTANPLISTNPESWSDSEINFMSYAQPLEVGNTDMVLSVNYHQVYDFSVEFNRYETRPRQVSVWSGIEVDQNDGKSKGAISAYTLAGGLSMPHCPEITIGAGVNWYTQSLHNDYAWQIGKTSTNTLYVDPFPPDVLWRTDTETFDDFRAHNFTFGLLWDVHEKRENLLTFGLVYHTPFTATVDWEIDSDGTTGPYYRNSSMDVDFPASFGAGVNYRFSDSFSTAFDLEWKEWSKFAQDRRDTGDTHSPVDRDTLAYRLGGEYLFLEGISESLVACRAGVFYEPRPIPAYPDPVSVYGLSAGLGWTLKEQFSLDFAYQRRWGEEDLGNMDYEVREDFFVLSVIRYF